MKVKKDESLLLYTLYVLCVFRGSKADMSFLVGAVPEALMAQTSSPAQHKSLQYNRI